MLSEYIMSRPTTRLRTAQPGCYPNSNKQKKLKYTLLAAQHPYAALELEKKISICYKEVQSELYV